MTKFDQNQIDLFNTFIFNNFGLFYSQGRQAALCSRIQHRMEITGQKDPMKYFELIKNGPNDEVRELINEVTVQETSFFRNLPQFKILENRILPGLVSKRRNNSKTIRAWSAGCSTGEEVISILISILENPDIDSSWNIKVIGSDISTKALLKAREFKYSKASLFTMDKVLRSRYFEKKGETYFLKHKYQQFLDFRYHNLVKDFFSYNTDIIFCCNVMIYFKPEIKAAVYHRFYRALAEDGTLFIGHSETMKRVYEKFTPLYFDEAVVYKKALDQGKENNDF